MPLTQLSEICDKQFFTHLSGMYQPGDIIAGFLDTYSDELAVHFLVNYSKMPIMEGLVGRSDQYKLVYARFGKSLLELAKTLYQEYNPLHNVDVTEVESNEGSDTHTYSGTDTTTLVRQHTGTEYEQTENSALTSGSTYDNTNVADMKPISKTTHEFTTEQGTDSTGESTVEYGKELEMEYGRETTKTRKGNVGVMPTQDLLTLEYYTRMRITLFSAVVRACCETLASGVWED